MRGLRERVALHSADIQMDMNDDNGVETNRHGDGEIVAVFYFSETVKTSQLMSFIGFAIQAGSSKYGSPAGWRANVQPLDHQWQASPSGMICFC